CARFRMESGNGWTWPRGAKSWHLPETRATAARGGHKGREKTGRSASRSVSSERPTKARPARGLPATGRPRTGTRGKAAPADHTTTTCRLLRPDAPQVRLALDEDSPPGHRWRHEGVPLAQVVAGQELELGARPNDVTPPRAGEVDPAV